MAYTKKTDADSKIVKNEVNDTKSETNEEVKDTSNSNDEIVKMLEKMQAEIVELKKENESLKTQQMSVSNDNNSEHKKLDPNQEVTIINMFDGLMFNLKINDLGAVKTLNKFGQKIWVTLKEARDIVRLNDKFARLGYFIFEDRDVIEDLLLADDYEKIVDTKTLDKLPDLNDKVLQSIYNNANSMYREKIVNKFVTEYINGQDARFRDRNRINLLSDLSGQDLMLKITETEKADQLKG